jgi:hypothetical protein
MHALYLLVNRLPEIYIFLQLDEVALANRIFHKIVGFLATFEVEIRYDNLTNEHSLIGL